MTSEHMILLAVNVVAWLALHMGVAWGGTRLPPSWFPPGAWLFHPRRFERGGKLYERLFRVKQWKDAVPDGAAWFRGGFPKATFARNDPAYVERFVVETCRGELVHWVVFLCAWLFFLWNPPWAGWIMVAYGALANVPCIIIQRYNRSRLRRLALRRTRTPREAAHVST
jgi:glycosyl-4,4'-diaponeurosporenoate acyltransferase